MTRTRSQAAGECDECDSYTTNPVVNGCLLCDRCLALLPDPLGICHGEPDSTATPEARQGAVGNLGLAEKKRPPVPGNGGQQHAHSTATQEARQGAGATKERKG